MSVYRITRFASSNMVGASEAAEAHRSTLESAGAEFIDIVDYGNGKGVVIAKYPSQEAMEAATEISQQVFGKLVADGLVEGDSIHPHAGEVVSSF